MGRVPAARSRPASVAPGALRHREQTNGTKKDYKVVYEEVAAKKKPLNQKISTSLKPPRDYAFVAAGKPQLTLRCKELARSKGATIYVVTPGKNETHLSAQVHRVGYHFPINIVTRTCNELGLSLNAQGHILNEHLSWPKEQAKGAKVNNNTKGNNSTKGNNNTKGSKGNKQKKQTFTSQEQDDVDRQARGAIQDLFPAMPENDRKEIIRHAFELGTNRVGAQIKHLPLPRRVQLATVAHIRHSYTDYDALLKKVPYLAARASIEKLTLAKLVEWRGDELEDPNNMEDILREVIVISEDEDDEPLDQVMGNSGMSKNGATALRHPDPYDIIQTPQVGVEDYPSELYRGGSVDSDEMREVTALGSGQYVFNQRRNENIGSRHLKAWEQARDRFRANDGISRLSNVVDNPAPRGVVYQRVQREPSIVVLNESPTTRKPAEVIAVGRPAPLVFPDDRRPPRLVTIQRQEREEMGPSSNGYQPQGEPHRYGAQQLYDPISHRAETVQWDGRRTMEPLAPGKQSQILQSPIQDHIRSVATGRVLSPKDTVLPSIEPATPTSAHPTRSGIRNESEVIVLDSPMQNKRRRIDEDHNVPHRYADERSELDQDHMYPPLQQSSHAAIGEYNRVDTRPIYQRQDKVIITQPREYEIHTREHVPRHQAERTYERVPVDSSRPQFSSRLHTQNLVQPVLSPAEDYSAFSSTQRSANVIPGDLYRPDGRRVASDPYDSRKEPKSFVNHASIAYPALQHGERHEVNWQHKHPKRFQASTSSSNAGPSMSSTRRSDGHLRAEDHRSTIGEKRPQVGGHNYSHGTLAQGGPPPAIGKRPVIPVYYPEDQRHGNRREDLVSQQQQPGHKKSVEIFEDEQGRLWDRVSGRELIAIK